ncbi:MAG: hypothetical protein H2B02_04545 [Nitrosopumilaceae archaeon]|nr:hypothetical protein [Nitrosopumilaceae archaeon]
MDFRNKIIFGLVFFLMFSLAAPANADLESPKKQMSKGVAAEDVICKTGLSLLIRNNGDALCLTSLTSERFQERGLGFIPIKIADKTPEPTPSTPIRDTTVQFKDAQKEIQNIPASKGSIANFYITDDDLNIAHTGIEIIDTEGLLEFTINGIPIPGPQRMIETGPDTGVFYAQLQLPDTINGVPLSQDDIIEVRYFDESDAAGEPRVLVKSIALQNTYAQIQSSADKTRIGHEFVLRLYEPDANRDSKDVDRIPLNRLEYRGEGGIRISLASPSFDANSSYLLETGENTDIFEVKIKIPRQLDGKVVHIGDWYEIRYIDTTTPSGTEEKVILKSRIG